MGKIVVAPFLFLNLLQIVLEKLTEEKFQFSCFSTTKSENKNAALDNDI